MLFACVEPPHSDYHYKALHQAAGTKKLGDSQKAKALWTMTAARDRGDEFFYDPACKNDIQGRTRTRMVLCIGEGVRNVWKPFVIVEVLVRRSFVRLTQVLCLYLCSLGWRPLWFVQRFCRRWPFLDPRDVVGLRTSTSGWNVRKKNGPHGKLSFFLVRKEPFVLTKAVEFRPCVTAETLKVCALIGLHMIAEEATSLSPSGLSLDLGGNVELWRSNEPPFF